MRGDGGLAGIVNLLLALALLTGALGVAQGQLAPLELAEAQRAQGEAQARDAAALAAGLRGLASRGPGATLERGVVLGGEARWLLSASATAGALWAEAGADAPAPGWFHADLRLPDRAPPPMNEAAYTTCACAEAQPPARFKVNPSPLSRGDPGQLEQLVVRITDLARLDTRPGEASFKVYVMNATWPPPPEAEVQRAWDDKQSLWAAVVYKTKPAPHAAVTVDARSRLSPAETWKTVHETNNGASVDLARTSGQVPSLRETLFGVGLGGQPGHFDVWYINADRAYGQFNITGVAFDYDFPEPAAPKPTPTQRALLGGNLRATLEGPHGRSGGQHVEPALLARERDGGLVARDAPLHVERLADGRVALRLDWWNVVEAEGFAAGRSGARVLATVLAQETLEAEASNATLRLPTRHPALLQAHLHDALAHAGIPGAQYTLATVGDAVHLELLGPCGAGCATPDLRLTVRLADLALRLGGG